MTQYVAIFHDHLRKLIALRKEQDRIKSQMDSVAEMVRASFANMTEEERTKSNEAFVMARDLFIQQELGLTDSIRTILQSNTGEWFSAVKVRDRLKASNFDFSGYTSDPLASIHAVLKRFKRAEVKVRKSAAGIREYRWIGLVSQSKPNLMNLDAATKLQYFLKK